MKKDYGFLILLISILILFTASNLSARTRGIEVVIKNKQGKQVGLYKNSYALLIGVSDYTEGWPDLESVGGEIDSVEPALIKQGFKVIKVLNPTSSQLKSAFEDFIDKYGFDKDNRLLFFYSGHGYTRKKGKKGYLVPADAPDPRYDDKGFVRKALDMGMILAW